MFEVWKSYMMCYFELLPYCCVYLHPKLALGLNCCWEREMCKNVPKSQLLAATPPPMRGSFSLFLTGSHKGRLPVPNLMNFRKTSKQPLTPPTLFSENNVALFATKFFGVQRPHPFSYRKSATKFFGSEMTPPPPFGSFPKIHRIWYR